MENNEKVLAEDKFIKWIDTPFEYSAAIIILSLFFGLMYKTFGLPGIICIGFASIIVCLALIQREIKKLKNK